MWQCTLRKHATVDLVENCCKSHHSKERGGWKKKKKMHMLAIGFPLKRERNVWKLKYSNIPRVSNERKKTERKDVPVQQAQVGRRKEMRSQYIHRGSIDPWNNTLGYVAAKIDNGNKSRVATFVSIWPPKQKKYSKCYAPEMIRFNESQKKMKKKPHNSITLVMNK